MTKKHLWLSLFLIKLGPWRSEFLLKKGFQRKCFPANIATFLRTAFLWNFFCSLYFYVMIGFFGCFWVIDLFHISCTIALFSFITLVLESGIHSYFLLVFIPKFLVNITFARTSTSAPALFWLNRSKPGTTAEPWFWV